MDSQELLGLLEQLNSVWIFLSEVSRSSPRPLGGASFWKTSTMKLEWLKEKNNQKHFHLFVIFPVLVLFLFCTCILQKHLLHILKGTGSVSKAFYQHAIPARICKTLVWQ